MQILKESRPVQCPGTVEPILLGVRSLHKSLVQNYRAPADEHVTQDVRVSSLKRWPQLRDKLASPSRSPNSAANCPTWPRRETESETGSYELQTFDGVPPLHEVEEEEEEICIQLQDTIGLPYALHLEHFPLNKPRVVCFYSPDATKRGPKETLFFS